MLEEIESLKGELQKIKEEVKRNAVFSLQISFEAKEYEDIPSTEIKCPICTKIISDPYKHIKISKNFWNTGKLSRIECPHCQLIYGPLSVINKDPKRLSEDYKILYSYYDEGETPFYQKMAFDALEGIKKKKYLNYACGTWKEGISKLRSEGWNVFGFEPNLPNQHAFIKTNFEEFNNISFDGLFTHNFIEHIQNPIELFTLWNQMLKIGDRMVHSSPCFKWKYDFSNFHIFFFLGSSLEILAQRTGFKIIQYYDHKPEIDAEYTRIVVFEKIGESSTEVSPNIEEIRLGYDGKKDILQVKENQYKLLQDVIIKNKLQEERINELNSLYIDIVSSKSWKLIQKIKKIMRRN